MLQYCDIRVLGTGMRAAAADDGSFRFDAVPAATHRVRAMYIGYEPRTFDVAVRAGEVTPIEFLLKQRREEFSVDLRKILQRPSGVRREPSLHVAFELVTPEVRVGERVPFLVRMENIGPRKVRIPWNMGYLDAYFRYPNGDLDVVTAAPADSKTRMTGTVVVPPGKFFEQRLELPGRGLPGRYAVAVSLWVPTSDHKDTRPIESDSLALRVFGQ
jgi:carboxypeptidase family protein